MALETDGLHQIYFVSLTLINKQLCTVKYGIAILRLIKETFTHENV